MAIKNPRNPYRNLSALLLGSARVKWNGETFERWAAATGISDSTLRRRIQRPETIELGELRRMAAAAEVEPEQLIAALPL